MMQLEREMKTMECVGRIEHDLFLVTFLFIFIIITLGLIEPL